MLENQTTSACPNDVQNNNPDPESKDKLPDLVDLRILLQGVTHFILMTNSSPLEIGIPYGDEALKYDVFDQHGQRLMILCETNKYCKICCCKTARPAVFFAIDSTGRKNFTITRPCSCCCCCGVSFCGDMCCNGIQVNAEDGSEMGRVTQKFRCCKPVYVLKSSSTLEQFRIKGPGCGFCCLCRICCSAKFSIVTDAKPKLVRKVGEVKEDWYKLTEDPKFPDGENFGAKFPGEWDVCQKVTVLGALLLINFLHYEFDPCSPAQYCC